MAKDQKTTAEATIAVQVLCRCGSAFFYRPDGTMECFGSLCPNRRKRYITPKFTCVLTEAPSREGAD